MTLAYLLLAFGMSVEFTAHCIAYYNLAQGDALQRLRIALKATSPAVVLGGISTCLALIPMFFAPMKFARNCTGATLVIMQFVGAMHGLLILPCLLAFTSLVLGLCG